jgi:hypothetical protein
MNTIEVIAVIGILAVALMFWVLIMLLIIKS